jgi:hypothetical protein
MLREIPKARNDAVTSCTGSPGEQTKNLLVEGDIQFGRKQVGIERAASKKTVADFYRGHLPTSLIHLQHQVLGIHVLVDIHIDEVHSAIFQKLFGAAAIDTPTRPIHCDFFHT